MTLNVGSDFKKRWLGAPKAVRQTFLDDLTRVCDVLKPDTNIEIWTKLDEEAQKQSYATIKQAYIDLKLQLIEEARLRQLQALQNALEHKRASQAAYDQQLLLDEERKYHEQKQTLNSIRQGLEQQVNAYVSRYQKNPDGPLHNFAPGLHLLPDLDIRSELDTLRLRLQLEAEAQIEKTLKELRQQLIAAANEEIEIILKNSDLNGDDKEDDDFNFF